MSIGLMSECPMQSVLRLLAQISQSDFGERIRIGHARVLHLSTSLCPVNTEGMIQFPSAETRSDKDKAWRYTLHLLRLWSWLGVWPLDRE